MTITPDDKDWTWVLDEACTECGLDTRTVEPTDVAAMVRDTLEPWRGVLLTAPADEVSRRPAPDTWSALEYGCHVRDVFLRFDERLHLMLSETDPQFPNWDQDATAVEDDYDGQDPVVVAGELEEAGARIADSFEAVMGEEWHRTGARSDGARFTVATFARYFIHDPIHHLYDVTGQRR
jgi:DinB superfamily